MSNDLDILKQYLRMLDLRVPDNTTEIELPGVLLTAIEEFNDRHDRRPPREKQESESEKNQQGNDWQGFGKADQPVQFSANTAWYFNRVGELDPAKAQAQRDLVQGNVAKAISKLRRMGLELARGDISIEQFVPVLTAACRKLVASDGELKPISSRIMEEETEPAGDVQMSLGCARRAATPQEADRIADEVWGRRPKPTKR